MSAHSGKQVPTRSVAGSRALLIVVALTVLLTLVAGVPASALSRGAGGRVRCQAHASGGSARLRPVQFAVHYNPPTCQGTIAPWPAEAQAAFAYATQIWSSLLAGSQTIEIGACWTTDESGAIPGSSGVSSWHGNFCGAPIPNTLYPAALANQLASTDRNGDRSEMDMKYNAHSPWYFGLDGQPPAGQLDFVTAVLHEIAHGLGLSSSLRWDDGEGPAECDGAAGQGCWGIGEGCPLPTVYDRLVDSGAQQNLVGSFRNGSAELGGQVTSGDLYFAGLHARTANGGALIRLYALPVFGEPSFGHLDEATFDATASTLMTPGLARGHAAHHPGPIVLGMLADMGWEVLPAP